MQHICNNEKLAYITVKFIIIRKPIHKYVFKVILITWNFRIQLMKLKNTSLVIGF